MIYFFDILSYKLHLILGAKIHNLFELAKNIGRVSVLVLV